MAGIVRRITVVSMGTGETDSVGRAVYKRKRKRKRKVSKWLRPLEKMIRRSRRADQTFATEALKRHDRSNRKRRNGFIRDAPLNILQAARKRNKKLKLRFV